MIRKPVHSRYCSSKAPSPHKHDCPGAENSGSEDCGEDAHVEVTTYEVDIVLQHFGVKDLEKISPECAPLDDNFRTGANF